MKERILKVLFLHDSHMIAKSKRDGRINAILGAVVIVGALVLYPLAKARTSEHYEGTKRFIARMESAPDIPEGNKYIETVGELLLNDAEFMAGIPIFILVFLLVVGFGAVWHGVYQMRVHQVIDKIQRERTEE